VIHIPGAAIDDGRYRLVREIAVGGMGRIWEGLNTRLDRPVAIREVSLDLVPPVAQAEFVQRAIREGRNAAALADHPNIVTCTTS
jgi:serine/threonine protein kinase